MQLEARPTALAPPTGPDLAGMTARVRTALGLALEEKIGLVLIAGPPGSGRAATLRALTACRPDAFAAGELGTRRAAEEALAAARGRLVLATLEAGDTISAVGRLTAMRIEPFAVAFALRLVLAQRLVRRLCQSCRQPAQPGNAVTAPLGLDPGGVVYEAGGCVDCGGSGYAGPAAAFEALPVDATIGRLIVCGGEEAAIAGHAFRSWPNLAATARTLAVTGQITAQEALRLIRDAQRQ
jgi:general secretion pathway protein E